MGWAGSDPHVGPVHEQITDWCGRCNIGLRYCISTITWSMPYHRSCRVFASLIFLPLSIDHIILTCLSSWFGIRSWLLNWFKSYLSSRPFRVKYDKRLLFRVYFFLWRSSRLFSRSCTFHHVYHPTQHFHLTFSKPSPLRRWYSIFFSFHRRNFDSSIAPLHTALQQISSWMSANL